LEVRGDGVEIGLNVDADGDGVFLEWKEEGCGGVMDSTDRRRQNVEV
jgi:hypothetical protein